MTRILLVLMIIIGALTTKSALGADISPVKTKGQHLFALKASRKYAGAMVEVYNSNGDLITSQKISKRRMIIDFGDTKLGEYTIRVVKGNEEQKFQYIKK